MRPRLDWISYNEPDRHLDELTQTLLALPGLPADPLLAGLSYKDEPVLDRLAAAGRHRAVRPDFRVDLGIEGPGAGMETLQDRLDDDAADRLVARHGRPDLLIARHLLEHSNDLRRTVAALRRWVRPGGYLVFEVPDSAQTLADFDYSTLWEEHVLYFTAPTLAATVAQLDLERVASLRYPYPLEDCLVAIARNAPSPSDRAEGAPAPKAEFALGANLAAAFAPTAQRWRDYLAPFAARPGAVAIFGAGHRAATFINLLGLAPLIGCVIDDDPRKAGLHLPGSGLPIRPSSILADGRIELCLTALSPESDERVHQRQGAFLVAGGRMESIYPRSRYASPAAATASAPESLAR